MAKLSQLNLPIKDESTGQITSQTFDIGGKEYTAGYGISISNTDEIASTTFVGTQAEWDALTPAEQAAFDIINITDDYTPSTEIQISYVDSLPVAGIKDVVYGLRSFGTPASATAADGFLDSVDAFTKTSLLPSGYEYTSGTAEISLDGITYVKFDSIVYDGTKFVIDDTTDLALGDTLYYRVLSGITYYGGDANAQTVTSIGKDPVDVVADGNMNAVTSNAVYNEVADVLRTETMETIGGAASKAYSIGEYFIGDDGLLYKVTAAIASGGTITLNTNCEKTPVEEVLGDCITSAPALGIGYGTCDTAEATAAKTATLANYVLAQNGYVTIKFTYAVPANATLNINSQGAKAIYYHGAAIDDDIIKADDLATFIYDGTNYNLIGIDSAIDGAGGGGSPTKVVVKEYTDTTQTLATVLQDIYREVDALSDAVKKKCYLELYSSNAGSSATAMTDQYVKAPFVSIARADVIGYDFGCPYTGTGNLMLKSRSTGGTANHGSSSWSNSNTLSELLISKIALCYDMLADITSEVQTELSSLDARVDALEQGGGGSETIIATQGSTTYSQALKSIFYALRSNITGLSLEILSKVKIRLVGYSSLNGLIYNCYFVAKTTDNKYQFMSGNGSSDLNIIIGSDSSSTFVYANGTSIGDTAFVATVELYY